MIVRIIVDVLQAYIVVLLARIILTWFPINPWSRLARVERVLATITDPVLKPVRRILPPIRVGAMGLDLSPIVVFFALEILVTIIRVR
ncbi:MAG: YggT family protein [Acidimicrobiales bacterium]